MFPWTKLPFREAIAFFREKQNVDTDSWRDVMGTEYDAVFAVAGAKGALLNDLREAVDRAIAEGITLEAFRKTFDQVVATRGWSYQGDLDWRTNIIYQTNLRTAYGAGRFEQLQQVKSRRPYWQWRHGGSRHPRPLHLAMDGRVFSADDPFWGGLFPPCGYGCKCTVFALGDRDLARDDLKVEAAPKLGSTFAGEKVAPDAGWTGRSGVTTPEQKAQLLEQVTQRLHPSIAAQVRADVMGAEVTFRKATIAAFDQMVDWQQLIGRLDLSEIGLTQPKLRESLGDCKWLTEEISEQIAVSPASALSRLRGVVDSNGRLQSVALIDPRDGYVYVDSLATAPWNILKEVGDERVMPGAGRAAIVRAIEESVQLGNGGRLRLTPLSGARGFYERLGFTPIVNDYGIEYLELAPDVAQGLLSTYRGQIEFMEKSQEERELDELEFELTPLAGRARPKDWVSVPNPERDQLVTRLIREYAAQKAEERNGQPLN